MKNHFLFLIILVFLIGCEENEIVNENIQTNINVTKSDVIIIGDSITEFYGYYAKIVKNPNDTNFSFYCSRIDKIWDFLVLNRVECVEYLLSDKITKPESLYGSKFKETLKGISKLPNNVHILFLIESLSKGDYLFGRRVLMGNNLATYLQNPVSIFPIFQTENGQFPEFEILKEYNQKSFMNMRPNFSSNEYSYLIDSVILEYKREFNFSKEVKSTNLIWFNYEDKFNDNMFIDAKKLDDSILRYSLSP